MGKGQPTVSIVMAVYNTAAHINDAIKSLLAQTFQDFELIIIDDGSTDKTVDVIHQFLDERIMVKRLSHQGLAVALNIGIRLARGEYIARMDADDIAMPERLEKQIRYLIQHPKVAACGTAYEVITDSGALRPATVPLLTTSFQLKKALPRFNPFCHGTMMIRRSALDEAGLYDESFELAQDYELWLRLASKYEMTNLSNILLQRREGNAAEQKESRQNFYGLRARWQAIQRKQLPIDSIRYLLRPLLVMILPLPIKRMIRHTIKS